MGTFLIIIAVIFVIALLLGANAGEAFGGILIALICLAQWLLPFVILAWLISLFL